MEDLSAGGPQNVECPEVSASGTIVPPVLVEVLPFEEVSCSTETYPSSRFSFLSFAHSASLTQLLSLPWVDENEKGTVAITEQEAREVEFDVDRGLRPWGLRGLLMGPISFFALFWEHGLIRKNPEPYKAACWIGCSGGACVHCWILFQVSFSMFSLYQTMPWAAATCFYGATGALLLIVTILARKLGASVDPGPIYQVYGIPDMTMAIPPPPPDGTVSAASVSSLYRTIRRLRRQYMMLAVLLSLIGICSLYVLTFVFGISFICLSAWPFCGILGIVCARVLFCWRVDQMLDKINTEEELVKGNLAWVLRRARLTLRCSLWLVRREPEARRVSRAWDTDLFSRCDPSFRRVAKIVLWSGMKHAENGSKDPRWLPQELSIYLLGYLATPDLQSRRHITKAKRSHLRIV